MVRRETPTVRIVWRTIKACRNGAELPSPASSPDPADPGRHDRRSATQAAQFLRSHDRTHAVGPTPADLRPKQLQPNSDGHFAAGVSETIVWPSAHLPSAMTSCGAAPSEGIGLRTGCVMHHEYAP